MTNLRFTSRDYRKANHFVVFLGVDAQGNDVFMGEDRKKSARRKFKTEAAASSAADRMATWWPDATVCPVAA